MVLKENGPFNAMTVPPAGQAARKGSQSALTCQKYLTPGLSLSFGTLKLVWPVTVSVIIAPPVPKALSSLTSTVKLLAQGARVQLNLKSSVGTSVRPLAG